MILFLVGLPGSGKSTIGKALSQLTGFTYTDTDEIIASKEQATIEEIFSRKGEAYFRNCEKTTLTQLIAEGQNSVVSTGGGLPCFFDNMTAIKESGISIFLNVSPETIAKRLWTTENFHRPLIKGKTQEQLLDFLILKWKERLPFYSQSQFEFRGDLITAEEIYTKLRAENIL